MFGYISIDKPELKIKEYETFRAYYCGLCHGLKEYSQKARMLLNYDCAFLFLLTEALREGKPVYKPLRCAVHPLEKRAIVDHGGAEYAAAVNVMLGVLSLKDHAEDEKDPAGRAAAAILKKDYQKAREKYPEIAEKIEENLARLSAAEKAGESDIDKAADHFAVLLAEIFEGGAGEDSRWQMRALGYNLGRWIYLIDAWDDFNKDVKKGNYNPFIARYGKVKTEEMKQSAEFHLNASAANACMAYDLLEIRKHDPILKNILYSGIYKKTEQILKGGKK